MPDQAHLKSFEALESFRITLIQYLEKASVVLDEAGSELRQIKFWLEDRQKKHWMRQVRLRSRELEEAKHAAFGQKLAKFRDSGPVQQTTVRQARQALAQAEEKLRLVKLWARRYSSHIEPLGREFEKTQTVLVQDLKRGAAFLERLLRSLQQYAGGDRRRTAAEVAGRSGEADPAPGEPEQ